MIYGEIRDIKKYKGISKNLDKAIDFIFDKKYLDNKIGTNEIDGDIIYFNCPDRPKTRNKSNLELEYHKRYVDIHVVIDGEESIGYTPREKCEETKAYEVAGDYGLMKTEVDIEFYLNSDKFLMFFPEEPHVALLKVKEEEEIKKVIFKVEL